MATEQISKSRVYQETLRQHRGEPVGTPAEQKAHVQRVLDTAWILKDLLNCKDLPELPPSSSDEPVAVKETTFAWKRHHLDPRTDVLRITGAHVVPYEESHPRAVERVLNATIGLDMYESDGRQTQRNIVSFDAATIDPGMNKTGFHMLPPSGTDRLVLPVIVDSSDEADIQSMLRTTLYWGRLVEQPGYLHDYTI